MNSYSKNARQCMQPFNQMVQGQMPLLPTGVPTGPSAVPPITTTIPTPTTVYGQPAPVTTDSIAYTAGFLKTQIGRKVRVEFLIGNGPLVDRTGTLRYVGTSYIILQPIDSDDLLMCDLYSIKFVTIIL